MIREEQNGSLSLLDASGKVLRTVGIFETDYGPLEKAMDLQNNAARRNTLTRINYENVIAGLQISVDAGRVHEAVPPKPQMQVISDTGEETWAPFVPPLKDLVPAPPVTAPSSGSIKQETPDLVFETHRMVRAMYRKVFPDV